MKRGPSTHDTGAWFALHETLLALPDFHPEVAFMWGNPINRSALRGQDPQMHKLALDDRGKYHIRDSPYKRRLQFLYQKAS